MDFLSKLKNVDLKNLKNLQLGKKSAKKDNAVAEPKIIKEINLVPDIKNDFIKTLKFRNLVFFLCIIIASGSVIVILISLTIAGGQQGFIDAKQKTIDTLQQKISDYSDLSDFLTIRDQLGNIAAITEQKKVVSRTFNVLSAMIPRGEDTVSISKLVVNLSEESEIPTFNIEAHANAGAEPFIDYKVLDSFKKSMDYMRYDYGEYVDRDGQVIPAYCMIENANDGSFLYDNAKGYYAYWLIEGEGCNPSGENEDEEEEEEEETTSSNSSTSIWNQNNNNDQTTEKTEEQSTATTEINGYKVIDYEGQKVVQVWRTPQYTDWYKENPEEGKPYMDLDGGIYNIEHFNSACIKYVGIEDENDKKVTWSATNETCRLVPEPSEEAVSDDDEEGGGVTGGIYVSESHNARNDDTGELLLSFNATIAIAPEVFDFNNHHMLAIPPYGRRNVTDSYIQIQSIFAKRARNCSEDDIECNNTPTSADSDSNNKSTNNSSSTDNSNTNDYDSGDEEYYEEEYYEEEE